MSAMITDLSPHDEYLERGVLGSILVQPDARNSAGLLGFLVPFLDPRDFFRERNRLLYVGVVSAYRRDGHALFGDVVRRLRGRLAALGDTAALAGLAADCLPAEIVRESALEVAELGLERLLLEARRRLTGAREPARADDLAAFHRRVEDKRARIASARATLRNTVAAVPTRSGPVGIEIPE